MTELHAAPGDSTEVSATRAKVGGIGGGTGLIAIAQSVGTDTIPGAILMYASPALAYALGALLLYVDVWTSRYLAHRVVRNARKTLMAQLDNPRTSDEHKAKIRTMLEELEESVAADEVGRVKLMRVSASHG